MQVQLLRYNVSQDSWCMLAGTQTMCGLRLAAFTDDIPFTVSATGRLCEQCQQVAPMGIGEPAPLRDPDPPSWS